MRQLEQVWESVKKEETALLSTSAGDKVTMRTVSPVYYQDAILIFTDATSIKYKQLKKNPCCCVAVGGYFVETKAEFLGHTMTEENKSLRDLYADKFKDAFDENVEYGGRSAEFILLKPTLIKGWEFENGIPTEPIEIKL